MALGTDPVTRSIEHVGAVVGEVSSEACAIQLHRPAVGRAGLRSFKVFIDGEVAGRLAEGATHTFPVAPGVHRLWVHLDWSGTPHCEVDVPAGQVVGLQVHFTGSMWNPLRDTPQGLLRLEVVRGDPERLREVAAPAGQRREIRWRASSRVVLVVALTVLASVLAYAGGLRLG